MASRYKVLVGGGIDYPDPKHEGKEKHAKEGSTVDDLPEESIPSLLKMNWVAEIQDGKEA